MAKKKFSDLPATTSIGASDLLATSQVDADAQSGYTSKKITGGNVARSINVGIEYPTDLETEDKTIIGAINEINSKALAIDSASGDIASFETAISAPLVSLSTTIVAKGGGGTPSTPIPIVGYSEVNFTRCGINQFDEQTETGYYDSATGEKKPLASEIRSTNLIPVIPDTTYAKVGLMAGYSFIFFDSAKNFLSRYTSGGLAFATPANCYYIGINFGANYGNTYNNDISINYPSSDTDYHAYNGQLITLALGQTVYGGRLYFENGWKCDVTHNIVDMGNLNWTYSTTGYFYATPYPDSIKPNIDNNTTPNMLCSVAQADTPNHVYSGSSDNIITCTTATPSSIWIRDNSYTDAATYKTAMTGQKIAYELATPFTIDLSSSDMLDAVVGKNNVFSDCGVTSLTFIDKMQHYVDKKIAELQALILQ